MKQISVVMMCVVVLLITGCQKDPDQGPTGPAGPAGPAGPIGATGSANVVYSDWFVANPWVKDTIFSVFGFYYNKTAPGVTQKVIDNGLVIVYAKLLGYNSVVWPANQISALPVSLTYQQGSIMTDTWSGLSSPGNVRIRFVNDKNYYTSIAATHQFRYIIIPGGVSGGRVAVDKTYEEVCSIYHIPM